MKNSANVDGYIESQLKFKDSLNLLRKILNKTELEETIKWGSPVYTLHGKNVVGLAGFKHHVALWFFNGVFLKDEKKLLVNAQKGKTKALRQMRFESLSTIDEKTITSYVNEAIENQKKGMEFKPEKKGKTVVIPDELKMVLNADSLLQVAFKALTPGKQREYCEHIATAKREATKQSRIKKITPMILQGIGLHDKYKNC